MTLPARGNPPEKLVGLVGTQTALRPDASPVHRCARGRGCEATAALGAFFV